MLTMLAKLNCPNDAFPSFPSKSFSFPDLFSSLSLSSPPWGYHSHHSRWCWWWWLVVLLIIVMMLLIIILLFMIMMLLMVIMSKTLSWWWVALFEAPFLSQQTPSSDFGGGWVNKCSFKKVSLSLLYPICVWNVEFNIYIWFSTRRGGSMFVKASMVFWIDWNDERGKIIHISANPHKMLLKNPLNVNSHMCPNRGQADLVFVQENKL